MTDTANAPEREAGTPGPHEPDYKTAMLYHSDRADAYMGERDALTAELAKLRADLAEAQAKIARLTEALTPSGDTKAAYMSEFEFIVFGMNDDGEECSHKITVPWTAIKEIMAAIKARAALQENKNV